MCLYLFDHKDLFSRDHYLLFFETTMYSRNVPMVRAFYIMATVSAPNFSFTCFLEFA